MAGWLGATGLALAMLPAGAGAAGVLGSAQDFTIVAHETITNAHVGVATPTRVFGDIGVSPGSSVTGFAPVDASANAGVVTGGSIHLADAPTAAALADAGTAWSTLRDLAPTSVLSGQNLGGLMGPLQPGIYRFAEAALLDGTLTLDFGANPGGQFVFQIASTLTTGTDAKVDVVGAGAFSGIYWQIGSAAILGEGTDFAGNLLARSSITFNGGAQLLGGRALALDGAVTLIDNGLSSDCAAGNLGSTACLDQGSLGYSGGLASAVPEPDSLMMLGAGLALLGGLGRRRARAVGQDSAGASPAPLRAVVQT